MSAIRGGWRVAIDLIEIALLTGVVVAAICLTKSW